MVFNDRELIEVRIEVEQGLLNELVLLQLCEIALRVFSGFSVLGLSEDVRLERHRVLLLLPVVKAVKHLVPTQKPLLFLQAGSLETFLKKSDLVAESSAQPISVVVDADALTAETIWASWLLYFINHTSSLIFNDSHLDLVVVAFGLDLVLLELDQV